MRTDRNAVTDHIAEEFKTSELVLVAEAIGLSPTSNWGSRKLIDAIRVRLVKNGVPVDGPEDKRQADLLDDYLYLDLWVDEDGNIVEEGGIEYPETVEEYMAQLDIEQKPLCWSYADVHKAPECKKCPVFVYCAEERVASLPACYGLLHSNGNPECQECLEAYYCKFS